MAIKVDLENAYDRLWWEFLEDTLRDVGLPRVIISGTMHYITTPSMQILWNSCFTDVFSQSRGVRKGYLVHKVNATKAKVFFTPNVDKGIMDSLVSILEYKELDDIRTYLGPPLLHGRVTRWTYHFFINKICASLLSLARNVTLAKLVLLSIPNFFMQPTMIPFRVCEEIENIVWLLRGSKNRRQKIALMDWNTCCQPISNGGLVSGAYETKINLLYLNQICVQTI